MVVLLSIGQLLPFIIAAAVIFLAYAFGAVYVIGNLFYFRGRLSKKLVALGVLFAEKKDILLSVFQLFEQARLPIEELDRESCSRVRWLKTEIVREKDVMAVNETLGNMEKRLTLLAENEPYIKQSEELGTLIATLKDIDVSYRRIVNVYNADVAGYMYWKKFLIYRWLSFLFGFGKKERIA